MIPRILFILLACLIPARLLADQTVFDRSERLAEAKKLAAGLKLQSGDITLGDNLAKIALPSDFFYLSPEDTDTVLVKIWGNPPQRKHLGMIVPADFDALSGDTWSVAVDYEEDGYVKDDDAAKIDYAALLAHMKKSVAAENSQREKAGYRSIELIGWATPPHYDSATHKLYWAKEFKFGDSPRHTLNYNIRILGRRGVLVLNIIASMDQLQEVEASAPTILKMVDFQPGHRYADFQPDTDKVAAYGIAALVAGGIAAKAGFFKVLWVGILALKKFIIIGIAAVIAFFKRLLAKRKAKNAFTAPTEPPAPPTT